MRQGSGAGSPQSVGGRHCDDQQELEQLKVNYANELRTLNTYPHPELLQHVIYEKTDKDRGGYSPLHTCIHDLHINDSEVVWKANNQDVNQCDYETRSEVNPYRKDNIAFVQPCSVSKLDYSTRNSLADVLCTEVQQLKNGGNPELTTSSVDDACVVYKEPDIEHDCGDKTLVYSHRDRLGRNPRDIHEQKRKRVQHTSNTSL